MDIKIKKKGGILYEWVIYGLCLLFLAGFASQNINNDKKSTDVSVALSRAAVLGGRISEYHMQIGEYPNSLSDLTKTIGQYGSWVKKIDKDPWGNDFVYMHDETDGYAIFSLGKDSVNTGSSIAGIAVGNIGYVGK
jgi:hypothetical protein